MTINALMAFWENWLILVYFPSWLSWFWRMVL